MRLFISLTAFVLLAVAQAQNRWPPVPPGSCGLEKVYTCVGNLTQPLPPCASTINWNTDTCCPDCWNYPECTWSGDVHECQDDETPRVSATTGCLSCRLREHQCSDAEKQACRDKMPTLPACPFGVGPRPDGGCCYTCRAMANPHCNATSMAACVQRIRSGSLPLCDDAESEPSVFDPLTCCRTCRPKPPAKPSDFQPGVRCRASATRACISESPLCEQGEVPVKDASNQCCQSCRRRERNCTLDQVVSCQAGLRECVVGEVPTYAAGEYCCPTCRPPQPTCGAQGCGSDRICTRVRKGEGMFAPECKRLSQAARLRLRATLGDENAKLLNRTSSEVRALLMEMVNRYCEQAVTETKCNKFQSVLQQMQMTMTRLEDRLELEVKAADPDDVGPGPQPGPQSHSPRHALLTFFREAAAQRAGIVQLSAMEGGTSVVVSAVADDESGEGYTVETDGAFHAFASVSAVVMAMLVAFATLV